MRAVQITRFGGPEVLELVDVPEPARADGHTLVRVDRAGINYADTHQIEDSYLTRTTLPLVPGAEVAGTAEDGRRVVALPPTAG
ncbi:MAG TPA: alcohol dehydrogenase catalytic domain-containing protein, partial [Pseudonocardiaceae bacterium]